MQADVTFMQNLTSYVSKQLFEYLTSRDTAASVMSFADCTWLYVYGPE